MRNTKVREGEREENNTLEKTSSLKKVTYLEEEIKLQSWTYKWNVKVCDLEFKMDFYSFRKRTKEEERKETQRKGRHRREREERKRL